MTRTLVLYFTGSLVGVALLGAAYSARDGWHGFAIAFGAGLICIIPTALTLAFTLWTKNRSSAEQLMSVMGGMIFRMAVVLTVSLSLFLTLPQLRLSREREMLYWSAVLMSYLGTLALETILTARVPKSTLGVTSTPTAGGGGAI